MKRAARPRASARLLRFLTAVLLLVAQTAPVLAAQPAVNASVKKDFARILFSWPERVPFKTRMDGRTLSITFDRPASPNLAEIKNKLGPYIESATMAADGRTAIVTMKHAYPVRTFISNTSSGIDLLQINSPRFKGASSVPAGQAVAAASPASAQPAEQKVAEQKPVAPPPASKLEPKPPLPPAAVPMQKPQAPVKPVKSKAPAKPEKSVQVAEATPAVEPAKAAEKPAAKSPEVPQGTEKSAPTLPVETTPLADASEAPAKAELAPVGPPAPKFAAADAPAPFAPEAALSPAAALDTASARIAEPTPASTKGAPAADDSKPKPSPAEGVAAPSEKSTTPDPATASTTELLDASAEAATLAATPAKPAATEQKSETPKAKPAAAEEGPAVTTEVAAPAAAGAKGLMVAVQKKKISADFVFPWTERVAAAGFTYGQDAWIVFSKPAEIDVAALQTVAPPYVTSIEQIPLPNATALRMSINEPLAFNVKKSPTSYEWSFSLSRRVRLPESPVLAETNTNTPKPFIMLPVLEAAEPLSVTHPDTQEDMVILPVYKPGQGTFPARQFVDARLPQTAQGILVIKNNDALRVVKLRNGIRLTTPDGLALSKDLPKIDLAALMSDEENSDSFFPYEHWKVADETEFAARQHNLLYDITQASDPKASRLRKKLAELYMGQGLYIETLSLLNLIRETDPEFFNDYQLAAMHGAANFMAQRIEEAALDFSDPSLEGSPEIDYWKRITAVMRGNENKLIKYMEFNKQFAKGYPPDMRRRLALIAADQAIGQESYQLAINIMKTIADKELMEPIADYRDFMVGRIYAETGKFKQAEETLNKLLEKTDDRFLRARAMFTLATTQYKAGEITKEELMKQLDALRIVWRGDQLELSLLELLGDLYVSEGDYISGLRAWKELTNAYPNTATALDISGKMAETFLKLFSDGSVEKLEPIHALGLFYEFRDLTPIGPDGDKLIQQLADRLVSVDLLDMAAPLLEHQVMHRLEKEERSRIGARLALIYMLKKDPKQAIQVLELTGYGNNPPELQTQRDHLAAQAYADTGDWETALTMLKDDFSREAKLIRLGIHWDNKNWPDVISTAEDLLASRANITDELNDEEAQTLMRLAVAYTMEGDRLQLQYLRDYFTALMANSQYKDSFDFITDDNGPVNAQNVQLLAQDMNKVESFLQNYRKSVTENGLSSAVN